MAWVRDDYLPGFKTDHYQTNVFVSMSLNCTR